MPGFPVTIVPSGAPPFVEVLSNAPVVSAVLSGGSPICLVADGAPPLIIEAPSAPINSIAPAVTPASPTNVSTLTTTNGTWQFGVSYTYQWNLNGVDQVGQTAQTYNLAAVGTIIAGDLIYCRVTATNLVGSTPVQSNTVTVV